MTRNARPAPSRLAVAIAAVVACATVGVLVAASPAGAATFSNSAAITTILPTCGGAPVASALYPSNIVVSGQTGTISDVNVTLTGMNLFEGDFEILLVGPSGGAQNLVLLSDAGSVDVTNFTLTLDDAAPSLLPQNGSWGSSPRTAKPTDYAEITGPADSFPLPAPAIANRPAPAGSATLASVFNGGAPNGTWSLYVVTDACDAPAETITGGWSLDITTASGAATTTSVNSSQNPSATGSMVTFTATVMSGGGPVATGTITFTEGATTLAANLALNGAGQAAFTTSTLSEGTHTITATYNGTASFATSNGSLSQRVDNATVVNGSTYCNTGPITVNALPNPATPYPSNIAVSGGPSSIGKVTATLKNVTHQFPDDIDVLLVGPTGQNLVLLSDAGTNTTNVTATFDDAAASSLAQGAPWGAPGSTVTSKPVDYDPAAQVDVFAAPAPAPSAATALAAFNSTNANGAWSLYVVSDGAPDTGTIAGGWCLTITAALASPTLGGAASPNIVLGGTVSNTGTLGGGNAPTGTITFTLYGPNDATCAGAVAFTSTVPVAGNGNYPSGSFTPSAAGTYLWKLAYSGDVSNNPAATACGAAGSTVVVAKAPSGISTMASAGGPPGTTVTDTATVTGSNPTGTVTFKLFNNNTCAGAPVFTSAGRPVSAGTATSAGFVPTLPGTYYWTADYSGDANNVAISSACGAPNESVTVGKATPSIVTSASANVTAGGEVRDNAVLSGGASPTGTIAFRLYGPDDALCSAAPIFTTALAVTGNSSYLSQPYTTVASGVYRWTADYDGDANNNTASSPCNSANESVTVIKASPTLTTTASAGVIIGGQVHDTATLAGGAAPAGTIAFSLYGPNDTNCAAAPVFSGPLVLVGGNGSYDSTNFTPTAPGMYRWTAAYSGDPSNNPASSTCNAANESVTVTKASPTLATTASAGIPVGGQVHDTGVLANGYTPTGTISFSLYGPDNATCAGPPVFTSTVLVAGNGSYDSASFTSTLAGVYRWTASYSSDTNNNPASSPCNSLNESVTIAKATPTISTQASAGNLLGAPVRDVATIAGGASPTGTVTFRLYSNNTCATQVFTSTNSLAGGASTSDWFTPLAAGTYYWTATYGGDANNTSVTSPCLAPNESVLIAPLQPPAPTQTITGDFAGPVTVNAGQSVLITDARVVGPVTVNPGGALTVVNSKITGGVSADAPSFFSLCGTQVAAPSPVAALSVSNAAVPVQVGDPAAGCAGNRFAGAVSLTSNLAVTFGANIVSSSATLTNNGPGMTVVKANTVYGVLGCTGNNPAPTNAGQVNTAGSKTGQCLAL